MAYRYECRACKGESTKVDTREEAENVQQLHRAVEHGGLAPAAGDIVRPSRIPVPQGPPPVTTRKALALLGLLAVGLLIARLLGQ
ncbi:MULTISPECIES: hypothetical protein [Actinomycetes]|uniref:Uncharacterized protein n=1 Tax=Streptomyces noursei TaxID=1971 RepID=A0A2N8P419_STRNR|nr:hypothetical protein [Streptomyces noursei]PNE35775.1 hypothetical protein AOB60_43075 [Streptomyces noursei]